MDKKKLSQIPREEASDEMLLFSERVTGTHIVTSKIVENNVLMLTFYPVADLKKGKREAQIRTFFSKTDYITQDLSVEKKKWLTASFGHMECLSLYEYHWDSKTMKHWHTPNMFFWTDADLDKMREFFKEFSSDNDELEWTAVYRFQNIIMKRRLEEKHAKETNPIDRLMETVGKVPEEFSNWVFDTAMSFSRYLVYSGSSAGKDKALVKCTHCQGISVVDRTKIRLRNNEKGICPMCGSAVTYKAKGKMPARIEDSRYVSYIEPREEGFLWRYFRAWRAIEACNMKEDDGLYEVVRTFYKFDSGGKECTDSYEYREYKQSGHTRWCPNEGYIYARSCILYPGNLPEAWKDTPMKYSALEILSTNNPSVQVDYPDAVRRFREFPHLEWFIKMGLYKIAMHLINSCGEDGYHRGGYRALNKHGETVFEILGLTKENTRTLQSMDGDIDALRLLQEAQASGYNLKADDLERFFRIFGCNTTLIRKENRNATIHKICRYIERESENYPIGERGGCWKYSYMRHKERPDVREERLQNCGKDWLDYIGWCKELKYDLTNMFFYLPKNFKKVHDRVQKEYEDHKDKIAAEKKRIEEEKARKQLEITQKAIAEIFKKNGDVEDAFQIKGKGLILVVPKNAQEIKAEGAALHHCVGTYVDRVAKGLTSIFFVRKEKEPDVPYFTMEYNHGKVIQCRGSHNCGMPSNVKAFVNVFEQKMKEQESKLKGSVDNGKTNHKEYPQRKRAVE